MWLRCSNLRAPSDPKAQVGKRESLSIEFRRANSVTEKTHAQLTQKSHTKEELTFWRFSFLFDENLSRNPDENRPEFEEYSSRNPPQFGSKFG